MPAPNDLPTIRATLNRIHRDCVDVWAARLAHEAVRERKLRVRNAHGYVTLGLAVGSAGVATVLAATTQIIPAGLTIGIAAATAVSKAFEPGVARDDQLSSHAQSIELLKQCHHRLEEMAAQIHEYISGTRTVDGTELRAQLEEIEKHYTDATKLLDVPKSARDEAEQKLRGAASAIVAALDAAEHAARGDAPSPPPAPDALPEYAEGVVAVSRRAPS